MPLIGVLGTARPLAMSPGTAAQFLAEGRVALINRGDTWNG